MAGNNSTDAYYNPPTETPMVGAKPFKETAVGKAVTAVGKAATDFFNQGQPLTDATGYSYPVSNLPSSSGSSTTKPASTGSGSGNGSYSSVPLTGGNYSIYGGVPLNNTSSGAVSDNGSTNTPASTGDGTAAGNTGVGGSGSSGGGYSGGGSSGGGSSGGSGATPSGNGTQPTGEADTTEPEKSQEEQLRDAWAAAGEVTKRIVEGATPDEIDIDAIDKVDVNELESKLEQIRQIQEQRATGQIDYAVEQGVNDVNRAVEDAAPQFQTQRNQISADEQRALDNQVLYAEARGDRGGIGQSQYASIQNNAATNRYRVNQEQTKLSTDAARQIADLRAKGEFEKADSLLQISQNYLSELKALEQWALQTNLSVDEFNAQLDQWKANYDLSVNQFLINAEMSAASLTGAFSDGTPTLAARNQVQEQLASAASALFQLGLPLTDEQIAALGWTKAQYTQYMNEQAVSNAAASYGDYYNPISPTSVGDDFVRAFQQQRGIEADGLIGNQTRAALASAGFSSMEDAYNFNVQNGYWK